MKRTANNINKDLEELLQSDDELPSYYDEIPEIPAYLDDNRFDSDDSIEFPWIEKTSREHHNDPTPSISPNSSRSYQDTVHVNGKPGEKRLILKGVLSTQDLVCLKCVRVLSSDTNVLWFINFLMKKDLQSNYKFLRSCLVNDIIKDNAMDDYVNNYDKSKKQCKFDIVIKY